MADEFLENLPLFDYDYISEEAIRIRMDADVNAGLDPFDERNIDTRPGGIYNVVTTATMVEKARLWDAISVEAPAAAFPATAWGNWLDSHAETFTIERKEAAAAGGTILFSGKEGEVVPNGIIVLTEQTDPDVPAIEFRTVDSGNISKILVTPEELEAKAVTGTGNLAAGTYKYKVTAINDYGETIASAEVSKVLGATGQIELKWKAVAEATGYKIYRSTETNKEKYLATSGAASYVDNGLVAIEEGAVAPPETNTTGGKFRSRIEALVTGELGNVSSQAINQISGGPSGITSAVNDEATSGGADLESDISLRERILLAYQGQGSGNIVDYERWALENPNVGKVTVIPVWSGPTTVAVVIMDINGDPLPKAVVEELQIELDPAPKEGKGKAPIGHEVTVKTPTAKAINISATVEFEDGFTLDGGSGQVGLRAALIKVLSSYVDNLQAGEDAIFDHIRAQFYRVTGVHKVTALSVNGGSADIAIGTFEVASMEPPVLIE